MISCRFLYACENPFVSTQNPKPIPGMASAFCLLRQASRILTLPLCVAYLEWRCYDNLSCTDMLRVLSIVSTAPKGGRVLRR